MTGSIEEIIDSVSSHMKKAITHLETEISKIRAGKATPMIVDAYIRNIPKGTHTSLQQMRKDLAAEHKADHTLVVSHSQDKKKNPLSVDKKVHYLLHQVVRHLDHNH